MTRQHNARQTCCAFLPSPLCAQRGAARPARSSQPRAAAGLPAPGREPWDGREPSSAQPGMEPFLCLFWETAEGRCTDKQTPSGAGGHKATAARPERPAPGVPAGQRSCSPPSPQVGAASALYYTRLQQQTEAINKSKPVTAGGSTRVIRDWKLLESN